MQLTSWSISHFFLSSLPVWKCHSMKQSVGLMKPFFSQLCCHYYHTLWCLTMKHCTGLIEPLFLPTFIYVWFLDIMVSYPSRKIIICCWSLERYLSPIFCHQQSTLYPNQCLSCYDPTFAICRLTFMRPTPESILGRTLLSKYSPTVGTAIECCSILSRLSD